MKRPLIGSALAAGLVALVLGSGATPALAHSYLVSSTPEENSVVTELPEVFSVTANEPLLDLAGDASGFAIQVVDTAGRFYGDGCLTVADSTLSMGATLGEAGDYHLYWQVVSADGHPVSGDFAFTWSPAAGADPSDGLGAPPVCGAAEPTPTATPTPSPTPAETAEPTPSASAEPPQGEQNWFMTALSDPIFILVGVLALLGAIAVILLAVRALRGMRGKGDDDSWNAPPSA